MFATFAPAATTLVRDMPITAADAAGELFGALIGEGDSFLIETEYVQLDGEQLTMKLRGSWFAIDIITVPADAMVITALRDQVIASATAEEIEGKLTEGVSVFSEIDSAEIFFFEMGSTTKLVVRAL